MTIAATVSEITYAGDDASTVFPIPFEFETAADLKVFRTDSDGNVTELSSGFSVAGGAGSTGTLTLLAALASGYDLTILDDPERSQDLDYVNNDAFPAETHEKGLDKQTRLNKRLFQLIKHCLRTADGDPIVGDDLQLPSVAVRAGNFLRFDANGKPEVATGIDASQTLSRSVIGEYFYPQSLAEGSAGVTIVNYFEKYGSPERYGTNDTGINAALAVANAAGGGTVTLTPGETYTTLTGILVPGSNITIIGYGATIEALANEIRPISTNGFHKIKFVGVKVIGFGKDTGSSSGRGGIHIANGSEYCSVLDCDIEDASGSGIVDDGDFSRIIGNRINETGEHGIYSSSPTRSVYIGNIITDAGLDTVLTPATGMRGIKIDGATRCSYLANEVYQTFGNGVEFAGTTTANIFAHNTIFMVAHASGREGISISGGSAIDNTVQDNKIYQNNARDGIAMSQAGTKRNKILDNMIHMAGDAIGISDGGTAGGHTIRGNTLIADATITTSAIRANSASSKNLVAHNQVLTGSGTWAVGITNEAGALNNKYLDNDIEATTKIANSEPTTVYRDAADYSGWVDYVFSAGNFTANDSMTWTVGAGDVVAIKWRREGKTLSLSFNVGTTTVAGTPSTQLRFALPAGFVVAARGDGPIYASDNGTVKIGSWTVDAAGTYIYFRLDLFGSVNWTASTNNTGIACQCAIQVT